MSSATLMEPKRGGFALPTAILLLLCMTAGVMTAFARVGAEARVVDNQRAETAAFAVAQTGLERYFARGLTTPADTTMVLPGGTARVRSSRVHRPAASDTSLYLIRSDGVVAGGARIPQGRRTVAQYAYHVRARVRVRATWTSLGGLHKAGSAGTITGVDACTNDSSIAGAYVPDNTYTYSGGWGQPLVGAPPLLEAGNAAELATDLKIDWSGITNPSMSAGHIDLVVCFPGTPGYDSRWGPCTGFPPRSAFDDDYWPTILVNGSARLPRNGHGILLVTGNLTLGGNDNWSGIVMVGNRITDNGSGRISGAVFSGMNAMKGEPVERSEANGTKNYRFNSCSVARAATRQSFFQQIPNAWADNWATW